MRTTWRVAMGVGLVATALVGGPQSAEAVAPLHGGMPAFGLVGVVWGQVARINVTQAASFRRESCAAVLAFVDAAGTVVARETVRTTPGETSHLEIAADSLGGDGVKAVRPVISSVACSGARGVDNPDFHPTF